MKIAQTLNGNVVVARLERIGGDTEERLVIAIEVFMGMYSSEVIADMQFDPNEARDLMGAIGIALEDLKHMPATNRTIHHPPDAAA